MSSPRIRNFGLNQELAPLAAYTPANEQEVLAILDRHRGQQVRTIGRLHSWSEVLLSDGVLLDLRHINQVRIRHVGDHAFAEVGAGCQIKLLLKKLNEQGLTLPSLGLITQQTIAGAISTGTHGSGLHSMSHYVEAVRLARYDSGSGGVLIDEIDHGESLKAARCSLGSLGVILSVTIRCRKQYNIQEHLSESNQLSDVLAAETAHPLQQFFLIPWRWTYITQHRCEADEPRSRLAGLYRLYWLLVMDIGLHLLVLLLVRWIRVWRMTRFAYRRLIPSFVVRNWKVTDRSSSMLVMRHDAFRHIEIELFVRRSQLSDALEFAQEVIKVAGGRQASMSGAYQREVKELGMHALLSGIHSRYCHHYPICVRRVRPDDTLISMSAGEGDDWYAMSFISYERPAKRDGFLLFAEFLAKSMSRLFDARPHWGKVCPLDASELRSLYPQFESFRQTCTSLDPAGAFRNAWTRSLIDESDDE